MAKQGLGTLGTQDCVCMRACVCVGGEEGDGGIPGAERLC